MQRKNSVLKRSGMAMIMAIFVIVIVSTILAVSLRLSTEGVQKTTDLYLYEQSTMLTRSATEFAMSELSKGNPCNLTNIDFRHNDTFDINISMKYITFPGSDCNTNAIANGVNEANTTAIESDGTVIMDVTVTANPTGTTEPMRYFRRSIQKL